MPRKQRSLQLLSPYSYTPTYAYTYVYIYIYICENIIIYVCMYVYIYIHIYINIHIYTYIHVMYLLVYRIHLNVYRYVYAHMACVYIYANTHILSICICVTCPGSHVQPPLAQTSRRRRTASTRAPICPRRRIRPDQEHALQYSRLQRQ